METVKIKLEGTTPLMVHSNTLSNPLHPLTVCYKAISSKRPKQEEDHLLMMRSEWEAGFYWDETAGPIMPAECIEAWLVSSAKAFKLGTTVKKGIQMIENHVPIEYSGPRTKAKMFEDNRFVDVRSVKVQTSRIMRTRPIFPEWKIEFSLYYMPDLIDKSQIKQVVERGCFVEGLCEYRPRFGKSTPTFI